MLLLQTLLIRCRLQSGVPCLSSASDECARLVVTDEVMNTPPGKRLMCALPKTHDESAWYYYVHGRPVPSADERQSMIDAESDDEVEDLVGDGALATDDDESDDDVDEDEVDEVADEDEIDEDEVDEDEIDEDEVDEDDVDEDEEDIDKVMDEKDSVENADEGDLDVATEAVGIGTFEPGESVSSPRPVGRPAPDGCTVDEMRHATCLLYTSPSPRD